jgi:hypothetical protein
MAKAVRLASHDMLIVIISDFFGANAETGRLVSQLGAHNDVLGLLVHDPMRVGPPRANVAVSDGARMMTLELADDRTRDLIVRSYLEEQQRITEFLRRLSAPLLMVSNEGDVVAQVRRLLGVPPRGR